MEAAKKSVADIRPGWTFARRTEEQPKTHGLPSYHWPNIDFSPPRLFIYDTKLFRLFLLPRRPLSNPRLSLLLWFSSDERLPGVQVFASARSPPITQRHFQLKNRTAWIPYKQLITQHRKQISSHMMQEYSNKWWVSQKYQLWNMIIWKHIFQLNAMQRLSNAFCKYTGNSSSFHR